MIIITLTKKTHSGTKFFNLISKIFYHLFFDYKTIQSHNISISIIYYQTVNDKLVNRPNFIDQIISYIDLKY